MKIFHLMAGVAALTLSAGAANAATVVTSPGGSTLTTSTVSNAASQGTASDSSGATFNLSATVAEDCSFFTGGGDVDVDFGTLGIYNTSNQGLSNAFRMTGAAYVEVTTSVAGCNTANRLVISKGNNARGMETDNNSGYDSNTFQNNLPYTVAATYTAAAGNSTGVGVARTNKVELNEGRNGERQGAFKSAMKLAFYVPAAPKALVAGEYTDTVEVTLTAI